MLVPLFASTVSPVGTRTSLAWGLARVSATVAVALPIVPEERAYSLSAAEPVHCNDAEAAQEITYR